LALPLVPVSRMAQPAGNADEVLLEASESKSCP
jgi:hypothetical protein